MPQTLLAVFAIAAASTLAYQGSRDRIDDATRLYRAEVQSQARGLTEGVLARLAGLPFDGGEGGNAAAAGPARFSPASSFGAAAPSAGRPLDDVFADPAFDDLDDFDGVSGAVARHTFFDPATGTTQPFDLLVSVDVRYARQRADGSWEPVEGNPGFRSDRKWAVVTVEHATLPGGGRLGRLFAAPTP